MQFDAAKGLLYLLPSNACGVGRAIEVKKNPQPTMEEVNEAHNQFVEALEYLFKRHNARVGYADLNLRFL
ncbi:hypothetical protein C3L33_05312, partial [Rhododendron williamsianum]